MATVNGKVVGVPALVDNLALVYNKKLFAQAGHLRRRRPNWTWSDFEQAAMKLTNPAKKQFGWAYVNDASEDTVWRFWAMLWQAGGSILSSDGKQAAFNSAAGVKALDAAADAWPSTRPIYLDNGSDNYLPGVRRRATSGCCGPARGISARSAPSKVDYGVQILPADLNHQTISGPDNWVMFNNGSSHVAASWEFLKWFTSAKIDLEWCQMTGDLPIRDDVSEAARLPEVRGEVPGDRSMGQQPQQLQADAPGHRPPIRRSRPPSARPSRGSCSASRSRSRRSTRPPSRSTVC